jgi:uncharacterized protein with PIN domain
VSTCVLDASALLALLRGERGSERVASLVGDAAMSVANVAEVAAKLVDLGLDGDLSVDRIVALGVRCHEVTLADARRAGARALQLHGDESEETVARLRDLGEWELWKAVRVRSGAEIRPAVRRFRDLVDLLLLDGWHPRLLGGTGRSFPWEALEEVRSGLPGELRLGQRVLLTSFGAGLSWGSTLLVWPDLTAI